MKHNHRRQAPAVLFVTDPWRTLVHRMDTSLDLARACLLGQRPTYWCSDELAMTARPDHDALAAHPLALPTFPSHPRRLPPVMLPREHVETVFVRMDPPVNERYLTTLSALTHHFRSDARTTFVNEPHTLALAGEKLLALESGLAPDSIISYDIDTIVTAINTWQRAVMKPLRNGNSRGIRFLNANSRGLRRTLTASAPTPVLVQRRVDGTRELRAWFVNGHPLSIASRARRPQADTIRQRDHLALTKAHPTRDEQLAIAAASDTLRRHGIALAAVDIITKHVLDINITSPGLLPAHTRCEHRDLAIATLRALDIAP